MNGPTSREAWVAAVTLACSLGASAPANAVLVTSICNDLACSGGDDITVVDNAAGDTSGALGAVSFSISAFGYNLLVNTSQSKPVIGSAAAPQLDLTFTASSAGAPATGIFLYASDTDFVAGDSFLLSLGGTNSGGSGTVTGRAWGGTGNTAMQFSAANLLGAVAGLSGSSFAGGTSGAFSPVANPYSLTIGTAITRATAGTTTGDLNVQVSTAPEPGTWALTGAGIGLVAFMAARRKRRS